MACCGIWMKLINETRGLHQVGKEYTWKMQECHQESWILNEMMILRIQGFETHQRICIIIIMTTLNSIIMCCWWVIIKIVAVWNYWFWLPRHNPSFQITPTSTRVRRRIGQKPVRGKHPQTEALDIDSRRRSCESPFAKMKINYKSIEGEMGSGCRPRRVKDLSSGSSNRFFIAQTKFSDAIE